MNEPNQATIDPGELDAARDRLTDRVLAEALGGETPPDRADAIVSQAQHAANTVAERPSKRQALQVAARVVGYAAAACLVVATGWLTVGGPPARRAAVLTEKARSDDGGEVGIPATAARSAPQAIPAEHAAGGAAVEAGDTFDPNERLDYAREDLFDAPVSEAVEPMAEAPAPLMPADGSAPTGADATQRELLARTRANELARRTRSEPNWQTFYEVRPSTPAFAGRGVGGGSPAGRASAKRGRGLAGEPTFRFNVGFERFGLAEQLSRDRYATAAETGFTKPVGVEALSTFSVDVDTASYTNARRFVLSEKRLPPAGSVRIEELVNYFDYGYAVPEEDAEAPFAASMETHACPWNPEHRLVRIGIKGREIAAERRPLSNLVFLIDVSGSMNSPDKLPLVVEGMKALTRRLGENDRVAIVVYAGNDGVVLPSTPGDERETILAALDKLRAGGSTAGGAGLKRAYQIAEENFIDGGVNRVVLCTDGDFNVGLTGTEQLASLVERQAKETGVYLTVLGFGRGNLNDAMLEAISGRGDGHYAYVDSEREARRVLSRDLSGTLVTIAKDVKLQVEFNPARVASYRLIGYENRRLAAADFNNDAKDAGEIGAGHTVTALYEVVPVGVEGPAGSIDELKYQSEVTDGSEQVAEEPVFIDAEADADELLTLKIRYKQPTGGASTKLEFPLVDPPADRTVQGELVSDDFTWAAAVAQFGMLLNESAHVGEATYADVLDQARTVIGDDPQGYRAEFLDLVRGVMALRGDTE